MFINTTKRSYALETPTPPPPPLKYSPLSLFQKIQFSPHFCFTVSSLSKPQSFSVFPENYEIPKIFLISSLPVISSPFLSVTDYPIRFFFFSLFSLKYSAIFKPLFNYSPFLSPVIVTQNDLFSCIIFIFFT